MTSDADTVAQAPADELGQVLHVGRAGIVVGNAESRLAPLDLPRGSWPVEIWVDAAVPGEVSRVVFVLPTLESLVPGSS